MTTPAQDAAFIAAFQAFVPAFQAYQTAQALYVTQVTTPPPPPAVLDDASGTAWSFQVPGVNGENVVLQNGTSPGTWPQAISANELALQAGVIYARNGTNWYTYSGSTWGPTSAPTNPSATLTPSS